MNRSSRCRVPVAVTALLFLLAMSAEAQEPGVRKLEDYREVSPFYEIPTLSTGFLSFTPETELDIGIGRLHAFLGERIYYDDNVYLADRDTTSDVVFDTTPGLLAEMFAGDHRLQLYYVPTIRVYADESDLDTVNHDAQANLRLDFVDAYARIADTFTISQDARDINFEGKVDRTMNRLEAEAGTLVGDYGLGIRGRWTRRMYGKEIPSWQDLDEYGAGLFGRWTGHVDYAVLLEYQWLIREYRGEVLNDSQTHFLLAGLESQPFEDMDYFLKAGLAYVNADDDGAVNDDSSLITVALEGEVRYRPSSDLTTRLYYVQRPEYASYSNYQMVYRGGVSVDWALDPGWLYTRGMFYVEQANPSNEPPLRVYTAGAACGANAASWAKVEVGYEWRRRLGDGSIDYQVNQVYVQGVIYF